MTPETDDDTMRYGLWPSVVGFLFGGLVMYLMFHLATGFTGFH